MKFKNTSELIAYINSKIQETLITDVTNEVKKTLKKHMDIDVYKAYTPQINTRRMSDGGLIDDKNIVAELKGNTVDVKPVAPPQGEIGTGGTELANWIESGSINHHQPFPRPFVANTINELQNTKKITKIVKQSLKSKGLKVR